MLRITKVRSAHAASSYFERDDYYSEGKSPSAWLGRGAAALGLEGAVDREAFQRVLAGELPNGQRLGTAREGVWQHAPGWDLTFSAPKSVSVLAEAGGDRRLVEAHERAVRTALEYIERESATTRLHTREGGDSVRHERTANLLVATFRHETSRAQDPQLHTHALVANATLSPDGKWRSLESRDMYRVMQLAGQIYQAELARECHQLGYTIEREGEKGQFELREVPDEIRTLASKRSQQINEWLVERGHDPKTAGREVVDRAVLATRATKEDLSANELRAQWRAQLMEVGLDPQAVVREARGRGAGPVEPAADRVRAAVAAAIEQLGEREQVFTERELLKAALVHGLGQGVTLAAARAEIGRLGLTGELAHRELEGLTAYTSRSALRREKEMLALAEKLRGGEAVMSREEAASAVERAASDAPHPWNPDQVRAAETLLSCPDRLIAVQGLAGTAKTTSVLRTSAGELAARGWSVKGIAPTASAAGVLGREIGARGTTLAQHLIDAKAGRGIGAREAWIVDEASLASTRQLRDLLRAADQHGARVVLVGDVNQLGSIEAGRAFAQVQEKVETVALEKIVRQRDENLLAAVYAAVRGDAREALDRVERAGSITQLDTPKGRREAAAEQYLALAPQVREQTIMVATSRESRSAINERVREGLKREGVVHGSDLAANILEAKDLTRAERKGAWSYTEGDVVRFGRNYKQTGIERDQYYRVARVDQENNLVHLVGRGGEEGAWRPDKVGAKSVQVFREAERGVAVGDRLVWTKNDRALGVNNGERLEVVRAEGREIVARAGKGENAREVRLDLGRDSHRHFDHAYCQTIHSSQGQTAVRVIAEMSSRSPLSTQRALYVAVSRAKAEAHVITDNKTELARAAHERSGEKTAALEQARATDRVRKEPERATLQPDRNHKQEYSL